MNWFKGSIAEAITVYKSHKAILAVYIEGDNEETVKFSKFLNDEKIRSQLESDDFVAIKIESNSESYMHFCLIYKMAPVPSIFFIGTSGAPIFIATSLISSTTELEEKINNVIVEFRNTNLTPSSSTDSMPIAATQNIDSNNDNVVPNVGSNQQSDLKNSVELNTKNDNANEAKDTKDTKDIKDAKGAKDANSNLDEIKNDTEMASAIAMTVDSLAGGQDTDRTERDIDRADEQLIENNNRIAETDTITNTVNNTVVANNIEENITAAAAAIVVDQQPRTSLTDINISIVNANITPTANLSHEMVEEKLHTPPTELKKEKERQVMQMDNPKDTEIRQKEQELKELKQSLLRERLEEQATRERIRTQIAADRAERAMKTEEEARKGAMTSAAPSAPERNSNQDKTCIQFRFASGDSKTHNFYRIDTLNAVRTYVKTELLPGTGINDFILAVSYPKREFGIDDDETSLSDLGLVPTAVILVIRKEGSGPRAIISRSGGIFNILTVLFWAILSPLIMGFGYVRNMFNKRRQSPKRTNDDSGMHQDAAKRRNLDRFIIGPSTSAEASSNANSSPNNRNIGGTSKPYLRPGRANIRGLRDNRSDSDDENATWNGNSTQQQ